MLKMKIEEKVALTIIQIYAPTVGAYKETKKFYNKLERILMKVKEHYTITMEDWNFKIGKDVQGTGVCE